MKAIVDTQEFSNLIYLHFRMIFRNTIEQKKLDNVKKIAEVLKKIVEETEIPDLPQTSVSYKIVNKILPFIDWVKIAQNSLEDTKRKF